MYGLQEWATPFYLSLFCILRELFMSFLKGERKAFPLEHTGEGTGTQQRRTESEDCCEAEELRQGCQVP